MAAGGSPAAAAAGGVRFVPLLGVHSQQPLSYLLELDGFTFLLDCGWNDAYDPRLLQPVVEVLPHIDAGKQRGATAAAACLRPLPIGAGSQQHGAQTHNLHLLAGGCHPTRCATSVLPTTLLMGAHSDPSNLQS